MSLSIAAVLNVTFQTPQCLDLPNLVRKRLAFGANISDSGNPEDELEFTPGGGRFKESVI